MLARHGQKLRGQRLVPKVCKPCCRTDNMSSNTTHDEKPHGSSRHKHLAVQSIDFWRRSGSALAAVSTRAFYPSLQALAESRHKAHALRFLVQPPTYLLRRLLASARLMRLGAFISPDPSNKAQLLLRSFDGPSFERTGAYLHLSSLICT